MEHNRLEFFSTGDPNNPWRTLASREIYGTSRLRVRVDEVIQPDGQPSTYAVIEFKNWAVGIVPLTDDGYTYLVGQYRYTMDEYCWELPAGGGPVGSPPLDGAQRELQEETGIVAANWTYLGEIQTSNSSTNERGFAYLATGLTFGDNAPEETEDLAIRKVPFENAVQMALTGEISDALAVAALLRAWHYLNRGPFEPHQRFRQARD